MKTIIELNKAHVRFVIELPEILMSVLEIIAAANTFKFGLFNGNVIIKDGLSVLPFERYYNRKSSDSTAVLEHDQVVAHRAIYYAALCDSGIPDAEIVIEDIAANEFTFKAVGNIHRLNSSPPVTERMDHEKIVSAVDLIDV